MEDDENPSTPKGNATHHAGNQVERRGTDEPISITWALDDQIEFAGALVSNGTVSKEQLCVGIHHATVTGGSIGHALTYTGAVTQRQLMKCLEQM